MAAAEEEDRWARLLPELVEEVVRRVEASGGSGGRRGRTWCPVHPSAGGGATSPLRSCGRCPSPGRSRSRPRSSSQGQKTSRSSASSSETRRTLMFYLYLGFTNNLTSTTGKGKFLMAAKRVRWGAHTEYIISLDADDLSQGNSAYVGKLRSDFWGTNFKIYDSQPPYDGAKASSTRSIRHFGNRRIRPQVSSGNFDVGQVSYKYNLLKSRGPRRMCCTMECPSVQETWENSLKVKSLRYGYHCP